ANVTAAPPVKVIRFAVDALSGTVPGQRSYQGVGPIRSLMVITDTWIGPNDLSIRFGKSGEEVPVLSSPMVFTDLGESVDGFYLINRRTTTYTGLVVHSPYPDNFVSTDSPRSVNTIGE